MKLLRIVSILASFSLMSFGSCDSVREINKDIPTCDLKEKFVKDVLGVKGTLRYNTGLKKYCIYVDVPGSIDLEDVAVICNAPEDLQKNNLAVKFSGKYLEFSDTSDIYFPGQTYYNLVLSDFIVVTTKTP